MDIGFQDKCVFVTGGSRGIGKTICETFKTMGAKVIAPGRDEMDLSEPESVERYIKGHEEIVPDIFVHCAGMNKLASIEEVTDDVINTVFQVNFFSAVKLCTAFAKGMKENGCGKIVFVSSLYATVTREQRIPYTSSKNALTGLMKTLALELAPYGTMVNAVAPGYVMTDMTKKNLSQDDIKEISANIPTGRFQEEQEIADLIAFLCSDHNKSITGQLISVDGGFLCR
ncbi:MAG: SDR family oxidoreductase [Lachnospiraceae bacterium]|nr:SDR family oxidoreductase [Lachnospiraceae bacterium]